MDEDTDAENAFIQGDMQAWIRAQVDAQGTIGNIAAALLGNAPPPKSLTDLLARWVGPQASRVVGFLNPPTVAKVLLNDLGHYLGYLPNDMGLFSGQAARILFDSLLQKAVSQRKGGLPSTYKNLNFRDHQAIFQKKLLVSSNRTSR